jgi:hypothetical protein
LGLPADARVLATSQIGPIMAEIPEPGSQRRHVVAAFDVLETNWPMQVSFTVFVANTLTSLGWGATGGAGVAFSPGEVVAVPIAADDEQVTYNGPQTLSAEPQGGFAVLPMLRETGVYQAENTLQEPWHVLAVNLTDPIESDLRPVDQLEVGAAPVPAATQTLAARREIWHWFVWAALGMLLIEWLVFTRRAML